MTLKTICKLCFFTVLLAALQFSCTEVFYPKIKAGNGALVVDGKITNLPGPYEIKLFRTAAFEADESLPPETGAVIVIYDDKGNSDTFEETDPGVYHSQSEEFVGIIGNSYWIEITTSDGEKFESIPEIMPSDVKIDSIYGEEVEIIRGLDDIIKGVEFYFDATSTALKDTYIRWEYEDSWEWHTLNGFQSENNQNICYPARHSNTVQLFDATYLKETKMQHKPVAIVSEEEIKLKHRYVLYLKLYSITKRTYDFWNSVKKINQNQGGLYNITPSGIQGNMQACQDGSPVFGYFEVCSVDKKINTFNKTNFNINFPIRAKECEIESVVAEDPVPPDPRIFYVLRMVPHEYGYEFFIIRHECMSCDYKYPVKKPLFWP